MLSLVEYARRNKSYMLRELVEYIATTLFFVCSSNILHFFAYFNLIVLEVLNMQIAQYKYMISLHYGYFVLNLFGG